MDQATIILLVGILCVFLGIFGGGFQIKEITIPKIGTLSRSIGAVFGLALIVYSQMNGGILPANKTQEIAKPEIVTPQETTETPPIVSDLEAKLEELEIAWANLSVENKYLLDDYKKASEDERAQDLGVIQRNNMMKKLSVLEASIEASTQLNKVLDDPLATLEEKAQASKTMLESESSQIRLSADYKQSIQAQFDQLLSIAEKSPRIVKPDDFLTCRSIQNKDCAGSTSSFRSTKVSIWARVASPVSSQVTLSLFDTSSGEQVYTRSFTIAKSQGYRISSSKTLPKAGQYEARLYNEDGVLLEKRQFQVI